MNIDSNIMSDLQTLQLISEPNRFQMLHILFTRATENLCVNEIASELGASASSVSHHFAKLETAGLVESYKDGRRVCYKIRDSKLSQKVQKIVKLLAD